MFRVTTGGFSGAFVLVSGLVAFACSESRPGSVEVETPCKGRLAAVAEVPITRAEVDVLMANTTAAGARLTAEQSLRDLLWQESERQRLGLPGGPETQRSRNEAVRRYRHARLKRAPIDTQGPLPDGTVLTPCGAKLLQR
jgi:hypothetical protein